MFFIISTGRSGSTSIARTLNKVDGLYGVHEPAPELILESTGYRYGEVTSEAIRNLLHKTRFPTVNGDIYCESNQTLSLIIPELAAVFPQARFIWLVRNGFDVVASAYQKQWYSGHSENHARYEDCPPIEKAWIDGRIHADKVGEMSKSEWSAVDRFEKCCWYWGYINRVIGKDLKQYAPARFFILRLEDMVQDMSKLMSWMGIESQEMPTFDRDNIAKRIPFHWAEWSPKQNESFMKWCGEEMDNHYHSWRDLVGENTRLLVKPSIDGLKYMLEDKQARLMQAQYELSSIKDSRVWRFTRYLSCLFNN